MTISQRIKFIFPLISISIFTMNVGYAEPVATAPVSGFARSFILGSELSNATITILETGEKMVTDNHGKFGPFQYPIGKSITLKFEKWNYKRSRSRCLRIRTGSSQGPIQAH